MRRNWKVGWLEGWMKCNFHYSIIPLFLSFCFSSCEKDFSMKEPVGSSKMVINCMLDINRVTKVFVTKNFGTFGSSALIPLQDARVELYVNSSFNSVLPFVFSDSAQTFGGYQLPAIPTPGNNYSVKVIHPQYGEATAEDYFPKYPVVTSYQLFHYGDSADGYISKFRFRIQDDGSAENYFRINVVQLGKRFYVTTSGDTVTYDYEIPTRPYPVTILPDTVRDYGMWLLFSDEGFNGQSKDVELQFKTIDLKDVLSGTVRVEFYHISKAHYLYFKTLEQYKAVPDNSATSAVFSNVSNGYGIFMSQCGFGLPTQVR